MRIVDEDQVIEEEVVDNTEIEEELPENPETPEESDEPEIQDEEDDDEDRIVTIGDSDLEEGKPDEESDDKPNTPKWVKAVRKVNRKQEAEIKRLKKQLEAKTTVVEPTVVVGEKPKLSDHGYDDEKYAEALIAWDGRKRQVEKQATEKAKTVEDQNAAYRTRQEKYVSQKKVHSFKDFKDAEDSVTDTFSETQQSIIVQGAEDSALVVYALGKNPKELERLSKISNPIDFAFQVAKLEAKLKVSSKKAPSPEKRITGGKSGGMSGNSDKTLETLREKAAKTGNYTEVAAYKKKMKKKDK